MTIFLRAVRLLTMVVWVGGLIFFAFVEAPTAVGVMGTTQPFALLIGESVSKLDLMGQTCGCLFVIATIAIWFRTEPQGRRLLPSEILLAVLMIAATMVVQRGILPAMERDRIAAGGDIDAAAPDNPARLDFERLHPISEKIEGAVLLLGVGVIVLIAAEGGTRKRAQAS
jgi:uncharacterized membrane protein